MSRGYSQVFGQSLLRLCCTGCSRNFHQELCSPCFVPGWCPSSERWHPRLFPGSWQLLVSRPILNSKPHLHWLQSYDWLAFFWLHMLVIPDSPKTSQQQKKRGSKQLVTNIFLSSNQGSGRMQFCPPILFSFPVSQHLTSHSLTTKVHTYHKINFQCWAFGATLTFWTLSLPLDSFPADGLNARVLAYH